MYPIRLHVAALVASAALSVGVAVWVRRRDRGPEVTWMCLMLVAAGVWSLLQAGAITVSDRTLLVALHVLGAPAGLTVVAAWLFFALHFTNRDDWRTPPVTAAVVGFYLLFVVLLAAAPFTGWFWETRFVRTPFVHLVAEPTPLGTLFLVVHNGLLLAALVLVGRLAVTSRHVSRRQAGILFVGALFATGLSVLQALQVLPVGGAMYTPIGVGVLGVATAYALFRHEMLEINPVARDTILAAVEESVIVVDGDRRIVDYNRVASEWFPELDGSIGEHLPSVRPELFDDGELVDEIRLFIDDERREFAVSVTPLEEYPGGGHVLAFQEVTERNEYTRQLEQQTEQLDAVAGTISHDIRNPLTVAQGHARLIDENEHTEKVVDALGRIETIVDDTLTLAREGRAVEGQELVDLGSLAEDAWETTDTGDAALTVVASDATIYADPSRLRTILENLFRNATDHGPADVSIEVGIVEPDRPNSDDAAGFYVADDGPGIPPETRETVLEYGYTTADGGTGLGLSIVEAIADAHGWDVAVTESDSGGARFEFLGVDLVDEPETATEPSSASG